MSAESSFECAKCGCEWDAIPPTKCPACEHKSADPRTRTPDTSTIADKIAVMKAAIEGRAIEAKIKGCGPHKWHHCPKSHWNWEEIDYRVAPTSPAPPAPRYRPWKADEVPVGAVVMFKSSGFRWMITAVRDVDVKAGDCFISFEFLFANYILADGTPCGTLEGGSQ